MPKIVVSLFNAALILLAFGLAPAQAQLARTWVSSFGNDANDCNRPTPCRTFQRAHDNTLPSGEISILDPGGYGSVRITKTISIINDGIGEAGMLVSGNATGILIEAGPSDRISLRGLTIKGIPFGNSEGIWVDTALSLTIENCVIRNVTFDGITIMTANPATVIISNTLLADNDAAINVVPNNFLNVVLHRVEMYSNQSYGFNAAPGEYTSATISESVAANNGKAGFRAIFTTDMHLLRSVAFSNGEWGVIAQFQAVVRMSQNVIVNNGFGEWNYTDGAQIISYGDNIGFTSGNSSSQALKR